jgi:superoxide dismutase, Cu-Zn family
MNCAKCFSITAVSVTLAALVGCAYEQPTAEHETDQAEQDLGLRPRTATLRDAAGNSVATVVFSQIAGTITVSISASLGAAQEGIHGFHIHANNNPANGDGCIADPTQAASTHFVSADGHYNPGGATHGDHAGDMPALFVGANGRATMSFSFDRATLDEIVGKAVIIHQLPDNYGNVPVGTLATQYTPNSAEATTLTANTGNAGARIACGLIQ